MFSNNVAGLKSKIDMLKNELINSDVTVFTLQETHFTKKGKLKLEKFEIFEAIRKKKDGGTLVGILKELKPMLVKEYSDVFEMIVIEIAVDDKEIRIISGYGPQENLSEDERMPFFLALEEEIVKAELLGKSLLIQMDANSKLGPDLIKGDPHRQTANGRILAGILERHNLTVVNSLTDKCTGLITRRRTTVDGTEESIIDFVIVSNDMEEDIESLLVDEERAHALYKYTKKKNSIKTVVSDHNPMLTKMNLKWNNRKRKKKIEMFNLKNVECQQKFLELTSESNYLSSVFETETDLNLATNRFLKRLNSCLHRSFRKVKITEKMNAELEELFNKRKQLRAKDDVESKEKLADIEGKLAEKCAEENRRKILEEISGIECNEGGVNSGKLWKLRKKLFPKSRDPPTAMMDLDGNLVTCEKKVEDLAINEYERRLQNRTIKDDLSSLKIQKENLCHLRLDQAKKNKTPDWTMEQLEKVLKELKPNKSRDPMGYANEIFWPEVAGTDFKKAILKLMNRIRGEQLFPEPLELCNISSLWKRKGCRNLFDSYRGIFRVTILRTILDRLIYNDEYAIIDENLTDSNVGARKGRNIRDNIFVLNAVTNSVLKGNEEAVDLQLFDVEKCFDALWVEECINDLYDAGLDNDKLPLLFLENQNANCAVKTNNGVSRRINIKNIVMQGSVWGSLFCTTTMDKLGQMVYEDEDLIYRYKGLVAVPSICMVDDILSIQKCSESNRINAVINSFIEMKKLKLSEKKCSRIHVGKVSMDCPDLKVHQSTMKSSNQERYLGDLVDSSGTIKATIQDRISKGYGIISEIKAILSEIPLGKYKLEMGLKLRQAMFVNGTLFNSEAWHSVTKEDIRGLEKVDESLLRSILDCHAKVPLEFLYLESGAIPIRYILSSRRINYLQTILKRDPEELIRRIYEAQVNKPCDGDFSQLVQKDLQCVGVPLDTNIIQTTGTTEFKKMIKKKISIAALKYLQELQMSHSKVRNLQYEKLSTQPYLTSQLFTNDETKLLAALRSRTHEGFKNNFSNLHAGQINCPLECWMLGDTPVIDSQEHLLSCTVIGQNFHSTDTASSRVEYNDIMGCDTKKQKEIAVLFTKLLSVKEEIITAREPAQLDPCTCDGTCLCNRDSILTPVSIVCL